MSGSAQLTIQPSRYAPALPPAAGAWARGIPTPGASSMSIPAVAEIATCGNLLKDSPPTLLEEYQIVSYSIGFAVVCTFGAAQVPSPALAAEIALLINDQVRYVATQTGLEVIDVGGTNLVFIATGSFVSDLVNPINVGARDRLGLRAGVQSNPAATDVLAMYVGVQTVDDTNAMPFESTLTYNVIDLPARRRL